MENEYLIADPGKGRVCYHLREFYLSWATSYKDCEPMGIATFFETTPQFLIIRWRVCLMQANFIRSAFSSSISASMLSLLF